MKLIFRLILLSIGFFLAYWVRQNFLSEVLSGVSRFEDYPLVFLLEVALFLLFHFLLGLDSSQSERQNFRQRLSNLSWLHLWLLGSLVSISFFLSFHLLSRTFLVLSVMFSYTFQLLFELLQKSRIRPDRVLLLGSEDLVSGVKVWARSEDFFLVFLDESRIGKSLGLHEFVARYEPQEVLYLGGFEMDPRSVASELEKLELPPRLHDLRSLKKIVRQESDLARFSEYLKPLFGEPSRLDREYRVKRVFDLVVLSLILPVWFPLSILLIICLYLTQREVFFIQRRVGYLGRVFWCYKFKSMIDTGEIRKPESPSDSRLTPLGWFIRRTSLDELPQLINVLKGEMSLIGPRPEMVEIVDEHYGFWQWRRVLLPPGVTGLWQVFGRKQPIHAHMKYDYYYLRYHSIMLDLWILWRTIPVVLFRRGAF